MLFLAIQTTKYRLTHAYLSVYHMLQFTISGYMSVCVCKQEQCSLSSGHEAYGGAMVGARVRLPVLAMIKSDSISKCCLGQFVHCKHTSATEAGRIAQVVLE